MLQCDLSEARLRELVSLNEGLDFNEWLASHSKLPNIQWFCAFIFHCSTLAIAFFEHINLLYGTISEYCSMSGCPEMSGPCNR